MQVPAIDINNPFGEAIVLLQHELFEPNAPLTRPGTNADWIDPLTTAVSAGAPFAGRALRSLGTGATAAADATTVAADAPFIISPMELPAGFDIRLPIGRYTIPRGVIPGLPKYGDMVGEQIGKLVQGIVADANLTLNAAPGLRDPDIIVPEEALSQLGFEYAEIKPLSSSGLTRFKNQVLNVWDLEGKVLPITYDYEGNIYYGFSGPWK